MFVDVEGENCMSKCFSCLPRKLIHMLDICAVTFAGVSKDTGKRQLKSEIGRKHRLRLIGRPFKHQQNNLGPGSYDLGGPDVTDEITRKCQSGGWKRQLEMERWSSMPYFGCKDSKNKEKELVHIILVFFNLKQNFQSNSHY